MASYMTLPECLEVKKVDPDEEENKDQDQATDAETSEKVEAEVVDENKDDEQVDIPTGGQRDQGEDYFTM